MEPGDRCYTPRGKLVVIRKVCDGYALCVYIASLHKADQEVTLPLHLLRPLPRPILWTHTES